MKFKLPLPPTINSTYKIGRWHNMYKAKHAKDWEKEVSILIKQQRDSEIILGKCWINIKMLVTHDRDIDSSIKILLDAFEDAGVFLNDRLLRKLTITKIKVKSNPHVEIEIGQNGDNR